MSGNAQSELGDRIHEVIYNHMQEWNLTIADILGVLEAVKFELWMRAASDYDGDPESGDEEIPQGDDLDACP